MSSSPSRYAVIGNPIAHSKSPDIHARFAAQTGENIRYERILAPLDGFAAAVQNFIEQGGKGVNVTVPFKLEAHALASRLSDRAKAAGAVNTLCFDGIDVRGDNTDGVGLINDIVRNAGCPIGGKRVLLLGAGGAARGVMLPLLEQDPLQVVIANRTVSKADQLVRHFGGGANLSACEFAAVAGSFDVIINATSASLSDEVPPIARAAFSSNTLAYDMMYGPQPTSFLRFASQCGAQTRDGLGMLVEQAAESFFIWRGVRPDTAEVLSALRAQL